MQIHVTQDEKNSGSTLLSFFLRRCDSTVLRAHVVSCAAYFTIAIFKIKAYSRMNGTNLHSPVELQPEMHAESHLEEHPMSLL